MGLGDLRHAETVSRLAQAALAPATLRAYRSTWRSLALFVGCASITTLFPVSVAVVADFLAARFDGGCGATGLAGHCSAIAYGHRMRGLADPTSDFRIRKLLAGARRLRPSWDTRTAITIADLDDLCASVVALAFSPLEKVALRAAFTLSFFAMLRPGEVSVGGCPDHTIRLRDVKLQNGLLTISSFVQNFAHTSYLYTPGT